MVELIAAILSKTPEDMLKKLSLVKPYLKTVQLDMMDGKFVPNTTLSVSELPPLDRYFNYEFHWMYENPESGIAYFPNDLHFVNVEILTKERWLRIKKLAKKVGLTINPPTPFDALLPYINETNEFLIMTVNPGFSGQKYIKECEEKIKRLRKLRPDANIEVDGGIDSSTAKSAVAAGANKLVAASAIFSRNSIKEGIDNILSSLK
ncbi:MAG: hypothetical protein QW153_01815 [Candidatus Bilamarchaeaceae archaeon]